MTILTNQSGRTGLTIDYSGLGTVCLDELKHAILEDFHIVRNTYSARFANGLLLHLPVTNEYGEPIKVRHPGGPVIYRLHTSHYRPACWDYHL